MISRIFLSGVSAVALATAVTGAQAQTPSTTLYGGGGTLAAKVYRDIFNCYSSGGEGVYATSPGNPANVTYPTGLNASCTSPVGANVGIGYEPVGSGAGLAAFTTGNPASFGSPSATNIIAYLNSNIGLTATPYPEIQFAGSDAYLTATQAQQAAAVDSGAFQLPTLATPITLPVGSVQSVKLKTADVCGIFSGTETAVGKVAIAEVVVRSDGSGTSFIFSDWLAQNCPASLGFNSGNGFPSTAPNWQAVFTANNSTQKLVSASGSGGVAGAVNSTPGAITYVSPDYVQPVVANNAYPASVNAMAPTIKNVTARLAKTKYPKTYNTATIGQTINDSLVAPTAGGYPIVGFTFIDTYVCYGSGNLGAAEKGTELLSVLNYLYGGSADVKAILNGQGFVPATSSIVKLLKSSGGPLNKNTGIQNRGC